MATGAGSSTDKTYTGLRWQCVEYARRWWVLKRGITFGSVETADQMWRGVRRARRLRGQGTVVVEARPNGGARPPEIGDLLIYRAIDGDVRLRFGHVAVVVGVAIEGRSIEVAEQNFDNQRWLDPKRYARRLRLERRGSVSWRVVDPKIGPGSSPAAIYGWLHASQP